MKVIRNVIRAFHIYLFLAWSGIPIWQKEFLNNFFISAIENLKNKNDQYKEARDNGLFYNINILENMNPFQEIDYFNKKTLEYEELMESEIEKLSTDIKNSKFQQKAIFIWILKQPITPYGSWYSGIDKVCLLANYLLARKNGATPAQAVHWAHKWIGFQPVYCSPPILRIIRKFSIGQFLNLVYYSISRFLEVHFTRPWAIIDTIITTSVFLFILLLSTLELLEL